MAREISDISLLKRLAAMPAASRSRVCLRDPMQDFSNEGTRISGAENRNAGWKHLGCGFDPTSLFVRHYDAIKRAMTWHAQQGLLLMAFDQRGELLGQAWLRASLERTRALVIGRHEMCDLALPDSNQDLSLRHLAVLTRAISHDEVRVRVLDLRSLIGFSDESGRVLQSASSEGSLFLRVGPVTLMMLVTGASGPLPDQAEDAYACIPERVFIEERAGLSGAPAPRRAIDSLPVALRNSTVTAVNALAGPVAFVDDLCGTGDFPLGSLVVRAGGHPVRRQVSARALSRGILVGRYDRCDIGVQTHSAERLSRVHLLIVKDGDDLLALDTASTNGTLRGEREVRLTRLAEGVRLNLADALELSWHSSS